MLLQGLNSFFRRGDSFFRQKNSHENQSVHIELAFGSIKSQTMLSEVFYGFGKALVVRFLAMYNHQRPLFQPEQWISKDLNHQVQRGPNMAGSE